MKKLWKGMFMTPHLWESIYMAHRAGYDGCGAMILPRGGKGPLHELLAEPGLWSRVQTALDETGLFLDGIGNCIIDDPANVHPYGMGMSPEPDDLRDYFEFAGKHELGGVQTSVWTTNQDLAVERFDHLCAVCGEYGLTVNLEFVAWGICDDLQKAKDLLKMVGRSNARITLDIMHLYYSSVTPEEIAACPPELFGNFICVMSHTSRSLMVTGNWLPRDAVTACGRVRAARPYKVAGSDPGYGGNHAGDPQPRPKRTLWPV